MFVIDGNNLWYAAMERGEPLAGIARRDLLRVLDAFARSTGEQVVVVLDGHPPPGAGGAGDRGGAERVYAGPQSADEVIKRRVTESSDPRRLTVVSSDRKLLREVRKRRVRVVESSVFAGRLERWLTRCQGRSRGEEPAGKSAGLGGSVGLIDDWLRFLDLGGGTSDIMEGERAGSEDGGKSGFSCTSESSPSPDSVENSPDFKEELGGVFRDVQPLKRRKRRREPLGEKGADP